MLVRFLRDEGVDYIYGYPGGALLHVYDALFKEPAVTHILVRHEQAATHMADGYARAALDALVRKNRRIDQYSPANAPDSGRKDISRQRIEHVRRRTGHNRGVRPRWTGMIRVCKQEPVVVRHAP